MDGAARQGPDDFCESLGRDAFESLTEDLRARVKGELEPGERLLWAARSQPQFEAFGFVFYALSFISIFLVVLGAACLIVASDGRLKDGNELPLGVSSLFWGSVFLVGLIANWRSRVKKRLRGAGVCYAITDRRAIIWAPEPKGNALRIRAIPRGEIYNLVRVENPDGSGSVLFSTEKSAPVEWHSLGFRDVDDVRRVEAIVRNNLAGSLQTS